MNSTEASAGSTLTTHGQGRGSPEGLLVVNNLTKSFGALRAVQDVTFAVQEGQIMSMIGPNGAGKTTVFNVITGAYPATSGQVLFRGTNIIGWPDYKITALGIARTFQRIRVFKNLTVLDNVMVGAYCRTTAGIVDAVLRTPRSVEEEACSEKRALDLLRFVGLDRYQDYLASELSYGDQRRLEVARALATQPALLVLDEPTAGMNPIEKDEMMSLIRTIRDSAVTIFLVEHDMKVVMGISDRLVVLDHGVKIAEGPPTEIKRNEQVIEAYLGRGFRDEPTAS
jgi:branched-chain amino acid transport system ATP-binding protein